jgi:hypothetical protein
MDGVCCMTMGWVAGIGLVPPDSTFSKAFPR